MRLDVQPSIPSYPAPLHIQVVIVVALAVAAHMTGKAGLTILVGLEDSFEKQADKTW